MAAGLLPVGTKATGRLQANYTIHSDRQSLLPDGNILATGQVHIVNGERTLTVDAREAEYHRDNPAATYVTATGNPITYKGVTENGGIFTGRSEKLKYTLSSGEFIFSGDAVVRYGQHTLSAPTIVYNLNTRRITAVSSSRNRVRSVIYPEQPQVAGP